MASAETSRNHRGTHEEPAYGPADSIYGLSDLGPEHQEPWRYLDTYLEFI
ncbi:MAG: hypothetical protein M3O28_09585 [Actinomycetota bacterium]|nr:hypothetical protein [Actinomycetota bacterium]